MSYSRSYKPEYTEEQKKDFIAIITSHLYLISYYICQNKYPYDLRDGKKVKIDHWTLFYHKSDKEEVEEKLLAMEDLGYIIQENKKEDRMIPEIEHFHLIKEL